MQQILVKKTLYNTHFAFLSSICRLFSTSLPLSENPATKSPFAVEYLIKSFGLPMDKAVKASKCIPHLKFSTKPDSVLEFLREIGVSDADIKRAVTCDPSILCASLENTIKPRMKEIQEIGFSPSQVARLVPLVPFIFRTKYNLLQQNVEFWASVFGSLEGILIALKHSLYLLTASLEKVVKPNISFLEENCGVLPSQMRMMIMRNPSFLTLNPNKLKEAAHRAEKLGIPHSSGHFIYALQIAVNHSACSLSAKIKNLKNLGFSKEEIDSMIKKQPTLLSNSDERIRSSIEFLTGEAGLDLEYISLHPTLISFSLERRLIPRLYVTKSLKSKGICNKLSFYSVMKSSDEGFADRFVRPYRDIIPEVFEAYESALAGKISLRGKL